MEKFIVSARKYRPATFDSVVGQQHITTTLKNAIRNKQLAQAFLFCGPRGVGKTTSARILAKTINCESVTADTEPCNTCGSCVAFNEGRSLNIIELDAASNNGVDDIRDLVDQIRFAPITGNFKVYIVDEVHMLSQAAFNAFLKTLEEPPAHAIFILATTEKHKIIPTILSRCQIFDFNRIKVEDMATHLQSIAEKEDIRYETDGLHIIAEKADGGLRDALSMFDQIATFSDRNITYKAVIENLNILDYEDYFRIMDMLNAARLNEALIKFNDIQMRGFEGNYFLNGLAAHIRNLLVSRDEATIQLLETSENVKNKYKAQSRNCDLRFLVQCLNLCINAEAQYKLTLNKRFLVELTLMQMCELRGLYSEEEKKKTISESTTVSDTQELALPEVLPPTDIFTPPPVSEAKIEATQKSNPTPAEKSSSLINDDNETAIQASKNEEPAQGIASAAPELQFISSMPSLSSILSDKAKGSDKEEKISEVPQNKTPFTTELLVAEWNTFAKQLEGRGKVSLSQSMLTHTPVLEDDFLVVCHVVNSVQQSELEEIGTELKTYLSQKLHNDYLQLKFCVDKENIERKPYSNEEKYQYLKQRNPNLEKLKNMLKLDL